MPLFDRDAENLRKQNLKNLEDRRVRFAEDLEKRGFRPERMFFCSSENGSFVALARHNDQYAVIVGPVFGTDEDFILDLQDSLEYSREDIFEKGTGLNGAFGFGKKGAKGFRLLIRLSDGRQVPMDVVAGRTSWIEVPYKKNPLVKTRRRRGDANVLWDLMPIDPGHLDKIEAALMDYYLR